MKESKEVTITYVGVDVSKRSLSYFIDEPTQGELANTAEGHDALLKLLPVGSQVILEFTGVYHLSLCYYLESKQIAYTLLNPAASAGFARSYSSITKTDKADAYLLSLYGQQRQPEATKLLGDIERSLRERLSCWQQLVSDRTRILNRLEAHDHRVIKDEMTGRFLNAQLTLINEQLKELESSLEADIPDCYEELIERAKSVKGIGPKTSKYLILATQGLTTFESVKGLAKFIGIAPRQYQSGRYSKPCRMSRSGSAQLRGLLYNCATSAKRFNPACKETYKRLRARGKAHKVAMVAVMHKLLRQFFAVVKSGVAYDPTHGLDLAKS